TSASKRWRRESGWSVLCTTTWGSLITRQVASSVPQTPSVPNCYPCLRNKMGTICPVRTIVLLAPRDGFEPPTNGLSIRYAEKIGRTVSYLALLSNGSLTACGY